MPSSIKEEILARFKSIHAFCKAHPELCRGAVYQTVSGQYPGNSENYARRIRCALAVPEAQATPAASIPPIAPTRESLTQALLDIRCQNCRRINRRECLACRDQTSTEASQLFDRLFANL